MKGNKCAVCKYNLDIDDFSFRWSGEPFSKSEKSAQLCSYCGFAVVPKVAAGIAIVGTTAGDVFSAKEMREDGFTDKKRLVQSIKLVGQVVGLTAKQISSKLKG